MAVEIESFESDLEVELIQWGSIVGNEVNGGIKGNFLISACHLEVPEHQDPDVLKVQHQFLQEVSMPRILKVRGLHFG